MSLTPCFRLWECGAVLAGVRAKPCGWPAANRDPAPGGAKKQAPGQEEGNGRGRSLRRLVGRYSAGLTSDFPYLIAKRLSSNTYSNTIDVWNWGTPQQPNPTGARW